jgi:hypothetical protein
VWERRIRVSEDWEVFVIWPRNAKTYFFVEERRKEEEFISDL